MKHVLSLILVVGLLMASVQPADAQSSFAPDVLLRLDDIGMTHSVNMAMKDLAETGIPFSVSAMPATPWFSEAVEIMKQHPQISVGVHLTLNSEWRGYRWGPVLGKEAVPSLVDEVGYFQPSISDFLESDYDLEEVERELNAQVERALQMGLELDYVDHHMGTAVQTPELRAVVERVAERHGLGIPRYFGENYNTMWGVPIDEKSDVFFDVLDGELEQGRTNLIVIHAARNTPEMRLIDMNAPEQNIGEGEPLVHLHRSAEREMLLSEEFLSRVRNDHINLVNYRDVIAEHGLEGMQRPN